MTNAGAQRSPDWLPRILALVARNAEATADEQREICNAVGEKFGPEAKAKAEDLFARERAKSALEQKKIAVTRAIEPHATPQSDIQAAPLTPLPQHLPARSTPDQYLAEMNDHHAVIDDIGGKTVIASWTPSVLDRSKLTLAYHKKNDFLLQYSNRFVSVTNADGETSRKPLAIWWLGHRDRRQYRSVMFEPAGPMV